MNTATSEKLIKYIHFELSYPQKKVYVFDRYCIYMYIYFF